MLRESSGSGGPPAHRAVGCTLLQGRSMRDGHARVLAVTAAQLNSRCPAGWLLFHLDAVHSCTRWYMSGSHTHRACSDRAASQQVAPTLSTIASCVMRMLVCSTGSIHRTGAADLGGRQHGHHCMHALVAICCSSDRRQHCEGEQQRGRIAQWPCTADTDASHNFCDSEWLLGSGRFAGISSSTLAAEMLDNFLDRAVKVI